MTHDHFRPSEQQPEHDLEQMLSDYYGPPLEEQSLPVSAWQDLQSQLKPQPRPHKSWLQLSRIQRPVPPLPSYVQESFMRTSVQAHIGSIPPSSVRYLSRKRSRFFGLRVAQLFPRRILMTYPRGRARDLDQVELDVLLASGMAQYLIARRPRNLLLTLILYLLASIGSLCIILYGWQMLAALAIVPALLWILASGALILLRKRSSILRADQLVVRWLGRPLTQQGLQRLAAHNHYRPHTIWSEPALSERIRRISTVSNLEPVAHVK